MNRIAKFNPTVYLAISTTSPWEGIFAGLYELDERFNELERIGSKLDQSVLLHDKQVEVELQLKQELIPNVVPAHPRREKIMAYDLIGMDVLC